MKAKVKTLVLLATSESTKGGIATVLQTYRRNGLFERWAVTHIVTHTDGRRLDKIRLFLSAYLRFLFLLATGKIGLIHAHTASRASFWRKSSFLVPAYCFRIPVLIHLHGAEFKQFYENECNALKKWVVRSIMKRAEKVIVLSSQWEEWCKGILAGTEITPIFNPAPEPDFPCDSEAGNGKELLFLGRIGKRKGVFDLLIAVSELLEKHPTLKLTCCGDGELDEASGYAEEIGIADSVEFRRWVSGTEKSRLLNRATVYVLPSYNEGLPMGVLEAMSAGVPVVSTNVGGIPDAIESGVDGFLVDPGDIPALTRCIDLLLTDADERKRMAESARKKVERLFSPEKIVAQVEGVYRQFLPEGNCAADEGFSRDRF